VKHIRFLTALIFAVIVLLLLTAAAPSGVSPSAGGYTTMCYDAESHLVVLYGGQMTGDYTDSNTYSDETWTFDPATHEWTKKSPAGFPLGSSGGSMTYDSKADRCILSSTSGFWLDPQTQATPLQTWAYDASTDTWTQLADGPRMLLGQRIVYDSESDRTILFGGFGPPWTMGQGISDETWAYDYKTNTWTNMQPRVHPTGRNYIGMVYDSKADRVVLWGDWTPNYNPSIDTSVWTYDYNTNTWQEFEHKRDGPAGRDYINLAYDPKADKILMYGGYSYGNDETWVYDLNTDTWQQMFPPSNPGLLSRYSMVYVKDLNKVILYGGQDGPNYDSYKTDTWSYSLRSNTWTNISPGQ